MWWRGKGDRLRAEKRQRGDDKINLILFLLFVWVVHVDGEEENSLGH